MKDHGVKTYVCAENAWAKYVRDRSCLLRCSLLLKARLQNWHLYLRSGASDAFRDEGVEAAGGGRTATLAPGILMTKICVLDGKNDNERDR